MRVAPRRRAPTTVTAHRSAEKEFILVGDMHHQRLRHFVQIAHEAIETDAVIRDIDVGIRLLGHHERQQAAQTVAHRPGFAVAAAQGARGGQGRFQVLDALCLVEGAEQFEGFLPFGLGLVGDVDAGFDAPEQVRADCDEAHVGNPGAGVAHGLVHAEYFLDDDDGAGWFGLRLDDIGLERAPLPSLALMVMDAMTLVSPWADWDGRIADAGGSGPPLDFPKGERLDATGPPCDAAAHQSDSSRWGARIECAGHGRCRAAMLRRSTRSRAEGEKFAIPPFAGFAGEACASGPMPSVSLIGAWADGLRPDITPKIRDGNRCRCRIGHRPTADALP